MNPIVRLAEKTIATYVEAFIAAWLLADTINASTAEVAALAAVPAAFTVIANGLPQVGMTQPFYLALVLRAVRSFAAAFAGYIAAIPLFALDASIGSAAMIAGITAGLAVIKGGLATKVGDPNTPALLPAAA